MLQFSFLEYEEPGCVSLKSMFCSIQLTVIFFVALVLTWRLTALKYQWELISLFSLGIERNFPCHLCRGCLVRNPTDFGTFVVRGHWKCSKSEMLGRWRRSQTLWRTSKCSWLSDSALPNGDGKEENCAGPMRRVQCFFSMAQYAQAYRIKEAGKR